MELFARESEGQTVHREDENKSRQKSRVDAGKAVDKETQEPIIRVARTPRKCGCDDET